MCVGGGGRVKERHKEKKMNPIVQVFFSSQNIKQVLQLVFNVLVNGDTQTARNYAVDLLQELLRSPRLQQAIVE